MTLPETTPLTDAEPLVLLTAGEIKHLKSRCEASIMAGRHGVEIQTYHLMKLLSAHELFAASEATITSLQSDLRRTREALAWQPIESAPKDGTVIWVLSKADDVEMLGETIHHEARAALAAWNADGSSWVDEDGVPGCERAHHLETTGNWVCKGGWFQPDEVTHWLPLPPPPTPST